MDKWERVRAALWGETLERAPLALWRHFHREDRDAATLARVSAEFARRYDIDLVKLTPSGLYAVEDWGAEIVYPDTETEPPYLARPAVVEPGDAALAPADVVHSLSNPGPARLVVAVVMAPPPPSASGG